jgi:hypothetical protein
MNDPATLKITTLGGMLVVLLANINNADILKTIVLSAIGAIVSYTVSLGIRKLVNWWNTRKG